MLSHQTTTSHHCHLLLYNVVLQSKQLNTIVLTSSNDNRAAVYDSVVDSREIDIEQLSDFIIIARAVQCSHVCINIFYGGTLQILSDCRIQVKSTRGHFAVKFYQLSSTSADDENFPVSQHRNKFKIYIIFINKILYTYYITNIYDLIM